MLAQASRLRCAVVSGWATLPPDHGVVPEQLPMLQSWLVLMGHPARHLRDLGQLEVGVLGSEPGVHAGRRQSLSALSTDRHSVEEVSSLANLQL
jgi:hypothetical protein